MVNCRYLQLLHDSVSFSIDKCPDLLKRTQKCLHERILGRERSRSQKSYIPMIFKELSCPYYVLRCPYGVLIKVTGTEDIQYFALVLKVDYWQKFEFWKIQLKITNLCLNQVRDILLCLKYFENFENLLYISGHS